VFSIRQLDFSASPSGKMAAYKFRERWIPVPLPASTIERGFKALDAKYSTSG
jgi:hypothetical protein